MRAGIYDFGYGVSGNGPFIGSTLLIALPLAITTGVLADWASAATVLASVLTALTPSRTPNE